MQKEQRKLAPTSACRNQFNRAHVSTGGQETTAEEAAAAERETLTELKPPESDVEHSDGGSASTRAACAPPTSPPRLPTKQTHLYLFGRVLLFVPDVPRFVVQHLSVVQLLDLVDPDQPVLGRERLLQVLELDVLVADLCVARPIEAGGRPEVQLGTQRRCLSANKQTNQQLQLNCQPGGHDVCIHAPPTPTRPPDRADT